MKSAHRQGIQRRTLALLLASLAGPAWIVAAVAQSAAPLQAAGPSVPAESHLQAAQQQAAAEPALGKLVRRHCAKAAAPRSAALAVDELQRAEAAHQAERALPRPRAERLLEAVLRRECAAYHATRLQAGVSYPVWWHTRLSIVSVRPGGSGFEVQARVAMSKDVVTSSRVTFARGLHHACFVSTDANGQAACAMVDTHPHGGRPDAWADAHEGPVVATFAGHVSATRVQLPAVEFRDMPVFAGPPSWAMRSER